MWIQIEQPLNLAATLESGQVFRWNRKGEKWYGMISNHFVSLESNGNGLEFETTLKPAQDMEGLISKYFRLDDDLPMIQSSLDWDLRLAQAMNTQRGLRLIRQDPWECLISFICSSNSNISRISGVMNRIAREFGHQVMLGPFVGFQFPNPTQMASVGEAGYRALRLGYRAAYVDKTSKILAETGRDLEELKSLPYLEAKAWLMALPGVGAKVADCVLLFSLDQLQAFPIDVWVRRAIEEWYISGEHRSYIKLSEWAVEYFGPFAGYAQQYLFHHRRTGDFSGGVNT